MSDGSHSSMGPVEGPASLSRTGLMTVARADGSALPVEQRSEVESLLTNAEPAFGVVRHQSDVAGYRGVMARVVANAFVATDRYDLAWQVMAAAVPDDPASATEASELRLLEILLDGLCRGVNSVSDRLVDDVECMMQAGHRNARCSLLDLMHGLLLMNGRVDESLRLLRLGRVAPLEQLTGAANLLEHARPNVVTLAGGEPVVAGEDRIRPHAHAIVRLWRELSTEHRRSALTARTVVIWALGTTGDDVDEAVSSFGPDDGGEVEQLCYVLRCFGLSGVVELVAESTRDFAFAKDPTPGYLVACLGRTEEIIEAFAGCHDWALAHRLLRALRDVPAGSKPRVVDAIDALIERQLADAQFSLDGPHHTAITVPELLRRRAMLTGEIRSLAKVPEPTSSRLAAIQTEELIAAALARGEVLLGTARCASMPAGERHNTLAHWARYKCEVPAEPLKRMLHLLPVPEIRALAIAHYIDGLAHRGLILGPLLSS